MGYKSTTNRPTTRRSVKTPSHDSLDLPSTAPQFLPEKYDFSPRSGKRLFGLEEAPVYYPTDEEFADPLAFIERIRPEAEKYGICKIVPPKRWKPEFAMDTETFEFTTRIQNLSSMEGSSRAVLNYLDQLQTFHYQQGTPFTRVPMLDHKPLDLFRLKKEVLRRGGHQKVSEQKKWAEVGRACGMGGKTCTSLSHSVKQAFMRFVLPYEEYMSRQAKISVRERLASNMDSGVSVMSNSGSIKREADEEDDGKRSRRRTSRRAGKSEEQEETITLPVLQQQQPLTTNSELPPGYDPLAFDDTACQNCGSPNQPENLLTCDGCNKSFHLGCLDPPLSRKPDGDWFCAACIFNSGDDFGFEDGGTYSLKTFQAKANEFKQKYFEAKGVRMSSDGKVRVGEDEIEREFWRVVESPYESVEVEYGADLHVIQHGSGFPTPEKQPNSPYSTCGWNLNNMPLLPSSLFCHIRNDISGMMIPWLYVGMMFSTFCWHTEDHYTYSINYLHWGDTKTWYGVPSSDATKFETAMKKHLPELFEKNPDLLFHLTTIFSPQKLVNENVKVFACDQRQGEFVITFPQSYHGGFNHGYNFAEAVNFALPDWLPYGLDCVQTYRQFNKPPVFSHDELVINTARKDLSVPNAHMLKSEMEQLLVRESKFRTDARTKYGEKLTESVGSEDSQSHQCDTCKMHLHVTALLCTNCKKSGCLDHFDTICCCEIKVPVLHCSHTDEDLQAICEIVLKASNKPEEWRIKYRNIMSQTRKPTLKTLQTLITSAEKIPGVVMEEVTQLRSFLADCVEWCNAAQKELQKRKRSKSSTNSHTSNSGTSSSSDRISLKQVENLLSRAEEMRFDAPEIKNLQTLLSDVIEFRESATTLLTKPDIRYEELKFQYDIGTALDVDIEEVDLLFAKMGELRWCSEVEAFLSNPRGGNYEDVMQYLTRAKEVRVPITHELCVALLERKSLGEEWDLKANLLLKQKVITEEELEKVVKEGLETNVATGVDLFEKVISMLERLRKWRLKVRKVLDLEAALETSVKKEDTDSSSAMEVDSAAAEPQEQPTTTSKPPSPTPSNASSPSSTQSRRVASDIRALIKEMDDSPIKPTELTTLKDAIKPIDDWTLSGKKLFVKPNTPKSFSIILGDILTNAYNVTKVESGKETYCLCRGGAEGFMVECDSCKDWYHGVCVKVNRKDVKDQPSYTCPICNPALPIYRGCMRPGLEKVVALLETSKNLKYLPEEVESLETIVELMQKFREEVNTVLDETIDTTSEEAVAGYVSRLKDYCRCAEGLTIDIGTSVDYLRGKIFELAPPPEDDEEAEDPSALYCICRKPYQKKNPMIMCDKCQDWFHFSCVGLNADEADKMTAYDCPVCLGLVKLPEKEVVVEKQVTTATIDVAVPAPSAEQKVAEPTGTEVDQPLKKIKLKLPFGATSPRAASVLGEDDAVVVAAVAAAAAAVKGNENAAASTKTSTKKASGTPKPKTKTPKKAAVDQLQAAQSSTSTVIATTSVAEGSSTSTSITSTPAPAAEGEAPPKKQRKPRAPKDPNAEPKKRPRKPKATQAPPPQSLPSFATAGPVVQVPDAMPMQPGAAPVPAAVHPNYAITGPEMQILHELFGANAYQFRTVFEHYKQTIPFFATAPTEQQKTMFTQAYLTYMQMMQQQQQQAMQYGQQPHASAMYSGPQQEPIMPIVHYPQQQPAPQNPQQQPQEARYQYPQQQPDNGSA